MPRPSLKAQRSEEILDAYERCVSRYGVEGATLEKIAEEAQLQRSLLRHNVGNRDDLLYALVDRFIPKTMNDSKLLESYISSKTTPKEFINYLFDESYSDKQSILVAMALIIAAPNYPKIRPRLQKWSEHFTKSIIRTLKQINPKAKPSDYRIVAAGLVGIYFNVESLSPLGSMKTFRSDSKIAAIRLIESI
ncbi:MAG: TetR/AcrR family transcriptional regulator [Gammaproteobacteria bacterium]|nr:MAG: TetR/AcrR family transcriptional regulator [Gammaproteobacteria bacterium]